MWKHFNWKRIWKATHIGGWIGQVGGALLGIFVLSVVFDSPATREEEVSPLGGMMTIIGFPGLGWLLGAVIGMAVGFVVGCFKQAGELNEPDK
jgi:hypothetical protein